eukprot:tig00020564_g11407.t1
MKTGSLFPPESADTHSGSVREAFTTPRSRLQGMKVPSTASSESSAAILSPKPVDDRPEIIAVHGMWEVGSAMHVIRDILALHGWRVHCPTLPWHGDPLQIKRLGRASLRDYVKHLEDFIASLKLSKPPVLIGFSLGGVLVQLVASRIPVSALIMLAPGVQSVRNLFNIYGLRSFAPHILRWMFLRKPTMLPYKTYQDAFMNTIDPAKQREIHATLSPESGRIVFEIGFRWADPFKSLDIRHEKFTFPVMLQVGAEDRACPPFLQRTVNIKKFVHGIDYRIYPGVCHWIVDCPETPMVCADIDAFLCARLGLPRMPASSPGKS